MVDVGGHGRNIDSGIPLQSSFGQAFDSNRESLNIPDPCVVNNHIVPYVLLGDSYLMKPFPGKHLNEQSRVYSDTLSWARRTIENAFGILATKRRIFRRPIIAIAITVDKMTKATLCLYNYSNLTETATCIPSGFIDSEDSIGTLSQITGDI